MIRRLRGLLVAIPENEAEKVLKEIEALGLDCGMIGKVTEKKKRKSMSWNKENVGVTTN